MYIVVCMHKVRVSESVCGWAPVCSASSQIPNEIQFSSGIYPSQPISYASILIWKRQA